MIEMFTLLVRNVDVVYFGFSSEFDRTVFRKLLGKLEHYGITSKLLQILYLPLYISNVCNL